MSDNYVCGEDYASRGERISVDRPYPEGIAWDEALRQRRAKEELEAKYTIALRALDDIAWKFDMEDGELIETAREALKSLGSYRYVRR